MKSAPVSPSSIQSKRRRKGMALLMVLAMLGLMTLLTVALFSLSENELRGARQYSHGQQARHLADAAVDVVIAQLRKGANQDGSKDGVEIWTSQPGLVRQYEEKGSLNAAYKLYSSSEMILKGNSANGSKLIEDVPPEKWNEETQRYVDLNRPVARVGQDGESHLLFPIIDPRAMTGGADAVRGFKYTDEFVNKDKIDGVVTTPGDDQRLPMPVEWLYQLKDGTLGTLDDKNKFVGPVKPTKDNPIVGRLAFWTDDESSKVNVNTASEPTFWAPPTFFHEREWDWAKYQPVNGEFQRYPGHPATTALSPILFPDKSIPSLDATLTDRKKTSEDKERIYALIPKIGSGGTKGATVEYKNSGIAPVDLTISRKEHLYASLDEFLLNDAREDQDFGTLTSTAAETLQRTSFFLTANSRSPESNPFGQPKVAIWPYNHRGANYRNPFDNVIAFCSTLRKAQSVRRYMFERGFADSPTDDINRTENQELLNYLTGLLQRKIPGFALSSSADFKKKYGDDLPQILVEVFDYVRSVNLHDGYLAERDLTVPTAATGEAQNIPLGYSTTDSTGRVHSFTTFTDPRAVDASNNNELYSYPGHGQVTPSRGTVNGEGKFIVSATTPSATNINTHLGIARFPTISEVGLQFICCADNTDDTNTKDINTLKKNPLDSTGKSKFGGGSAARVKNSSFADPVLDAYSSGAGGRWYSNFPPLSSTTPNPLTGIPKNTSKYPGAALGGFPYGPDKEHPGYQPKNWNWQLPEDKPLEAGHRLVQARMLLEFFIPAEGFTLIEPEMTIVVKNLSTFQLNGKQLFPGNPAIPGSDEIKVYTGRRATHNGTTQKGGYDMGVKGLLRNRDAPARSTFPSGGSMPADNDWGNDNWTIKPGSGDDKECVLNYDLLSNFIDIDVGWNGKLGTNGDGSMALTAGGEIEIEIHSGHIGRQVTDTTLEKPPALVQTIKIQFPTVGDDARFLKPPTLVRNPIDVAAATTDEDDDDPAAAAEGPPAVEPPFWWTFYKRGALGFPTSAKPIKGSPVSNVGGRYDKESSSKPTLPYKLANGNAADDSKGGSEPRKGVFIYGFDSRDQNADVPPSAPNNKGAPIPIRPKRYPDGTNLGPAENAEVGEGSDVVKTMVLKHGDYRLAAAQAVVTSDQWEKQRMWVKNGRRLAHSFSNQTPQQMPGYDYGGTDQYSKRMVPNETGKTYANNRVPDFPLTQTASDLAHRYYDFDNAVGTSRDGAFINKPDEGNLDKTQTVSYFLAPAKMQSSGENFFTPNRQMPSPVMFGSLPSGVKANDPWRTLLFRPQSGHPGGVNPPDHLFLEFFWMPVVEPYAISEPFSTAGKVNLNYQIFPFTNIRRASGLHAVLENEVITAVPETDMGDYKKWNGTSGTYWTDTSKIWHYKVDVDKTLAQFDQKFADGEAFITPSQICEMHLVPKGASVTDASGMTNFWSTRRLTGDNTRERPYANIYPRVTTRSNTFRVHFVTQVIAKARSTDPETMEEADKPVSEYRGSTLVERYLDPQQTNLPDFATGANSQSLDEFHQFRILQTKKFGS